MPGSYALVTPARNEARTLATTIDAVAGQVHRPLAWIVVDDGSADATAEVVGGRLDELPFLRLVRLPDRGYDAVGGGVVEAFGAGLSRLDIEVDYLGKLDADIALPATHFAHLLERLDGDPRLGIASGRDWVERADGRLAAEPRQRFHPIGCARVYRRRVYEEIGPPVASLGWDTVEVIRAHLCGYSTRHFADLPVRHLRLHGGRGPLPEGVRRRGRAAYVLGYSPLYFALRVLHAAAVERPRPRHALWLLAGYVAAARARAPAIVTAEERRWLRRFQRRRLLGLG